VLVCLFCCLSAFAQTPPHDELVAPLVTATASNDRVSFISVGEVHVSRLQVFFLNGTQVFDSGMRLGNLIDWKLCDQQGSPVSGGSYLYLVTIRDFSDRITQKFGTAEIEADQVYLERSALDSLPVAQAAALESNKQAEVIAPIDRVGVAAMNRNVTGSNGSDGAGGTGTSNKTANATANGAPDARPEVSGTGTQNFLPKWTDNAGTLADSSLFSTSDRIGLGTSTPGAKFHVVGTQGSIGAGTFQLDTGTTFAGWTAAYPAFEVVNTNQTNNNVSLFQFADAPSGASHAGIGAVATNHLNKFGDLFFYTKQPGDSYQIRMGIFGSKVGIGTISPGFKLHVFDSGTAGLRVETGTAGGTIASFGANGDFQIDAPGFSFGPRFLVKENGNVGIGYGAPIYKLHIVNEASKGLRVFNVSPGGTVASFGGYGDFLIDSEGAVAGRLIVKENGNVGIGDANPGAKFSVSTNTTNSGNNTASFVDQAIGPNISHIHYGTSGDWYIRSAASSGKVVLQDSGGPVGIGTASPSFRLHIIDPANAGLRVQTNTAGGTVASFGENGEFQIDGSGTNGGRLIVKANGNVGIGNVNPLDKLNVNGNVSLLLAGGGTTQVCQNSPFQLAVCSSSLRYKQNIGAFGAGLNLVKRLSPITFNWKQSGMKDFGLAAEEVEKIEPLLVTYNSKGEVEGVKYDRVGVVLINAVKEQQRQIERQNQRNDSLQKRLNEQGEIIKAQQAELRALRSLSVQKSRRLKFVSRRTR